ncbi:MAG: phosphatidylserine/phosphatidylglycerophosphate/cardiolipin synthase family protein [Deltaproteobacteria bacterium]|nr:phosphatidylserine/phosphatidylglycerophosphate/cardiolipin synthase family protein [Deltaproteobacteria bacterium]
MHSLRALLLLLPLLTNLSACAPRAPSSITEAAPPVIEDCALWDNPRLTRRLDLLTSSVEREGNRAELLIDGVSAFPRRYENSADAELILVKTFIFYEDEAGHAIAKLLSERAQAGAEVWFQYDQKGSIRGPEDVQNMLTLADDERLLGELPLVRKMRKAGVHIIASNPVRRAKGIARWGEFVDSWSEARGGDPKVRILPRFDHEKYWITLNPLPDGDRELRVILGGLNIASEYAYGGTPQRDAGTGRRGWRDTDIELRGPVTNDVVSRYLDLIEIHTSERLAPGERGRLNPTQGVKGDAKARFVWNHPILGNKRRIERLYNELIDATPDGAPIKIGTAYFAPGRRITRPLYRAARDGGALTVITNSTESVDMWFVTSASRHEFRRLSRINPDLGLYEWLPQPEQGWFTYHSKQAAFGSCGPVIVGSANLDAQSSEHNSESVVAVRDAQLRADFDQMFAADLRDGRVARVDPAELGHVGPIERIKELTIYTFMWYWLDGGARGPGFGGGGRL